MKKQALHSFVFSILNTFTLLVLFITCRESIALYLSNQYVSVYSLYLQFIKPVNIVFVVGYIVSVILLILLSVYLLLACIHSKNKTVILYTLLHFFSSMLDVIMSVSLFTGIVSIFTDTVNIQSLIIIILLSLLLHIFLLITDACILLERIDDTPVSGIKVKYYYLINAVSSAAVVLLSLVLTMTTELLAYCSVLSIECLLVSLILYTSIRLFIYASKKKDHKAYISVIGILISISLVKVVTLPIYYIMIEYVIYGILNIVIYYIKNRKTGMKISEIVEATHGKLLCGHLNDTVYSFTQDSRQCTKGCMYIPIIGENNDGHNYIQSAFDNGASTIITDREITDEKHNIILVKDTTLALADMARYIRDTRNVKVVGITGSVGKTSTKDMIYSVVSQKYNTLKTLGNYNNQIGLPLTILRHTDEEVLVLEMGMNHLREIAYLSDIAKPDIAAITNVGTAHIGEVGGRENILKAKMEITEGLKENGILVINDDNDLLHKVKDDRYHIIRVGENTETFKPLNIQLDLLSSDFDINYRDSLHHVHVPVPGKHFITNALIALAIGTSLDIDIKDCIKGIESFELTKNRMDLIKLDNNVTVIDGTYNANLDSMKSSIDVLASSKSRKIAVLADMLELGEYEEDLHRQVGEYLSSKVDILLCVGNASKYILDAADHVKEKKHFDDNQSLIEYLKSIIKEDDVILVKGSNGMHLKEVVEALK